MSFNVFLPLLLQANKSLALPLYLNIVIYVATAVPASVIAFFLVSRNRIGNVGALFIGTLVTTSGVVLFALAAGPLAGRWQDGKITLVASCLAVMDATIMYDVIYAYTPEFLPTSVRGTGSGICFAVART